jgi:hypothetical protein
LAILHGAILNWLKHIQALRAPSVTANGMVRKRVTVLAGNLQLFGRDIVMSESNPLCHFLNVHRQRQIATIKAVAESFL